jgi:hypothetical protein
MTRGAHFVRDQKGSKLSARCADNKSDAFPEKRRPGVAKVRKMKSIPDLVEDEKKGPEQAMAALRKHLKTGVGTPYNDRSNFVADVLARCAANAKSIAHARALQWRIACSAILLSAAVAAAVQLSRHLMDLLAYRAALTGVAAVAIALVCWVAKKLMDRTAGDLSYYREQAKVNEEMMNVTLGIGKLASAVVAARRPDMEDRRPYGEEEDIRSVTGLLYALVVGAGVLAAALSALLAWFI